MPINRPETKIYMDLAEKGNYDAIVDLATDAFMKIVNNEPNAMQPKDAFITFYKDLIAIDDDEQAAQKNKNILTNILNTFYEKVANTAVQEESEIRSNIEKINSGEIPELSLLKRDPKKVRKAAEALTFSQLPCGLKAQAYNLMLGAMEGNLPDEIDPNGIDTAFKHNCQEKCKEKLKNKFNIPSNTLDDTPFVLDLMKAEFESVDDYYFSQYPVEPGKNVITATNQEYEKLKKLETHQLSISLAEKEKELELFKEKNKQFLQISEDVKKLGEALGKINSLNSENKAVKALYDEIENVSKFGTSSFTIETIVDFSTGRKDRIHTNAVNINSYNYTLKMLTNASKSVYNEYFETSTDEAKAANEACKLVEDFVSEHKKILELNKNNNKKNNNKAINNPDKDISLIKCEQQNRTLSSDLSKKLAQECHQRDQKINYISIYADSAQRGLDIISKATDWMTTDRVTHTRCSTSYTNFSQAMEDLGKMNAYSTSPEALLEKMRETYQAASVYYEEHTGWKHPLTGIYDNGKDRIRYSKLAMDVLEMKIAELTPKVEKVHPYLGDKTPGDLMSILKAENITTRGKLDQELASLKILDNQKEAQKQIAGVFIDKQIHEAQEALTNAKAQAGEGNYPDKETVKDQYAKIVSAITLKKAAKNSKYVPKTENFQKQCNSTISSPSFVDLIKSSTSEQLYKSAVESDGKLLFASYLNSFSQNSKKNDAQKDKKADQSTVVKEHKSSIKIAK